MNEFAEYLKEVFEPFGTVRIRRMFGGYGLYCNELMFALIADNILYLKADAKTAKQFIDKGLHQFQYPRHGKIIKLSYYSAPEEIFENPKEAMTWASIAYGAAVRSQKPPSKTSIRE